MRLLVIFGLLINLNAQAECWSKFKQILDIAIGQNQGKNEFFSAMALPANKKVRTFLEEEIGEVVGGRLLARTSVDENGKTSFYRYRTCSFKDQCLTFEDESKDFPTLKSLGASFTRKLNIIWSDDASVKAPYIEINEQENNLIMPKGVYKLKKSEKDIVRRWLTGSTLQPYTVAGRDFIYSRVEIGEPSLIMKESQENAISAINLVHQRKMRSLLIVGTAGLGKTEILLQNLKRVLKNKKQKIHFVISERSALVTQLHGNVIDFRDRGEAPDFYTDVWAEDSPRAKSMEAFLDEAQNRNRPTVIVTTMTSFKILIGEAKTASKTKNITKSQKNVNYMLLREQLGSLSFDEAHHSVAEQGEIIINELINHKDSKAFLFGMTATPSNPHADVQKAYRNAYWAELDDLSSFEKALKAKKYTSKQLKNISKSNTTAVERGELSPVNMPYFLNVKGISIGEEKKPFHIKSSNSGRTIVNPDDEVVGWLFDQLRPFLNKHRFSFFSGNSIEEIETLTTKFNAFYKKYGMKRKAVFIHSNMRNDEQEKVKQLLMDGVINDVFTVFKFDEGLNFPHLSLYVDLSKFIPPVNLIQRIGRTQRHFPGKTSSDVVTFMELTDGEIERNLEALEILERTFTLNKSKSTTKKRNNVDQSLDDHWAELQKRQDIAQVKKMILDDDHYRRNELYNQIIDGRKFSKTIAALFVDLINFVKSNHYIPYNDEFSELSRDLSKRLRTHRSRASKQFKEIMTMLPAKQKDKLEFLMNRQEYFGQKDRYVAILEQYVYNTGELPELNTELGIEVLELLKGMSLEDRNQYLSNDLNILITKGMIFTPKRFLDAEGNTLSDMDQLSKIFNLRKKWPQPTIYSDLEKAMETEGHWIDSTGPSTTAEQGLYANLKYLVGRAHPRLLPFIPGNNSELVWEKIRNINMLKDLFHQSLSLIKKYNGRLFGTDSSQLRNSLRILLFKENFPLEDIAFEYGLYDRDMVHNLLADPELDYATKINLFTIINGQLPKRHSDDPTEVILALLLEKYNSTGTKGMPELNLISQRVKALINREQKSLIDYITINSELDFSMFNDSDSEVKTLLDKLYIQYSHFGHIPLSAGEYIQKYHIFRGSNKSEAKKIKRFMERNPKHPFTAELKAISSFKEKYQLINDLNYYSKPENSEVFPLDEIRAKDSENAGYFAQIQSVYDSIMGGKDTDEFLSYLNSQAYLGLKHWLAKKNNIAAGDAHITDFRPALTSREQKFLDSAREVEAIMADGDGFVASKHHNTLYVRISSYLKNDNPKTVEGFINAFTNKSIERYMRVWAEFSNKYSKIMRDLDGFVSKYKLLPKHVEAMSDDANAKKEALALLKRMRFDDDGIHEDDFMKYASLKSRYLYELDKKYGEIGGKVAALRTRMRIHGADELSLELFKDIKEALNVGTLEAVGKNTYDRLNQSKVDPKLAEKVQQQKAQTDEVVDAQKTLKLTKTVDRVERFLSRYPDFVNEDFAGVDHNQWNSFQRQMVGLSKIELEEMILLSNDAYTKRYLNYVAEFGFERAFKVRKWELYVESLINVNGDKLIEERVQNKLLSDFTDEEQSMIANISSDEIKIYQKLRLIEKRISLIDLNDDVENVRTSINTIKSALDQLSLAGDAKKDLVSRLNLKSQKVLKSRESHVSQVLDAINKDIATDRKIGKKTFSDIIDLVDDEFNELFERVDSDKASLVLKLAKIVRSERLEEKQARFIYELNEYVLDHQSFPKKADEGHAGTIYVYFRDSYNANSKIWDEFIFKSLIPETGVYYERAQKFFGLKSLINHPERHIDGIELKLSGESKELLTQHESSLLQSIMRLNDERREEILKLFTDDVAMAIEERFRVKNANIYLIGDEFEKAPFKMIESELQGNESKLGDDKFIHQIFPGLRINNDGTIFGSKTDPLPQLLEDILVHNETDLLEGNNALYQRLYKATKIGGYQLIRLDAQAWQNFANIATYKSMLKNLVEELKALTHSPITQGLDLENNEAHISIYNRVQILLYHGDRVTDEFTPRMWEILFKTDSNPAFRLNSFIARYDRLPKNYSLNGYEDLLSTRARVHLRIKDQIIPKMILAIEKDRGDMDKAMEIFEYLSKHKVFKQYLPKGL